MRFAALLAAWLASPAAAAELEAMRWEMRPLLLFAPAAGHPSLASQRAALAEDAAGVADRRLAVYAVTDTVVPILGAPAVAGTAEALRRRFGVPADAFRIVLVGLDGGTKLSEPEPVPTARLFGLIDGMPMRRDELSRRD